MKHLTLCLALAATLIGCANKENLSPDHPLDISLQRPPAATLFERIDEIGMQPGVYTWKDLDKLYRSEVANSNNHDCKNATIFWLVESLKMLENAEDEVILYYLNEVRKNDFNTNLKLVLKMLERVENLWSEHEIALYTKELHDKNIDYWNANFPGQTSYLDMNKEAFITLLELSETSN